MSYASTYDAMIDAAVFQPRCYVAILTLAQDVAGNQGLSQNHRDWAMSMLLGKAKITRDIMAWQILRDATVGSKLNTASDAEIFTAAVSRLDDLVRIG